MALSVRGVHPQLLFAPAAKPSRTRDITLDAELSADAAFGGSPPAAAAGSVTFRSLSLNLAGAKGAAAAPIMRLQGSIPFALDKGRLTIPDTTIYGDGGFAFVLAGSLPFDGSDGGETHARLSVPWTEVLVLRPTLTTLTGGRPEATHLAGQFQASLELIDQEYHGELSLRNLSVGSNFFKVEGVTGVIPLHGQTGQGSAASADRAAPSERIGRRHLSEQEYHAAIERLATMPANAPASLTIGSLRYDPIEIRNIEIALASSESHIAVRRFAFDAWGGRWSAWGTVEPLGGEIALAVLIDGLSLRAICDAFPPIKGYISGRVNGIAELRIPGLALDQAQGSARFWAVDSPQERRKISRKLIERLAGQQIHYFSLVDVPRRYDRGVLDVALKAGDLIFHELEISHTVLGYKDLDVRVSPTFNKIGLAHLLESISEALERIRRSGQAESLSPGRSGS